MTSPLFPWALKGFQANAAKDINPSLPDFPFPRFPVSLALALTMRYRDLKAYKKAAVVSDVVNALLTLSKWAAPPTNPASPAGRRV
jgi:hypothetical protein